MKRYGLATLSYRDITSKFSLYVIALIAMMISIAAFFFYMLFFQYATEEMIESVRQVDIVCMLGIFCIFVLAATTIYLVFQLTLVGRLKMFAVLKSFGAKKRALFLVVFYEYLILLAISGVLSVGLVIGGLYLFERQLLEAMTLPHSFVQFLVMGLIGLESVLIVAVIAFIALVFPAFFYLGRNPSSVLREA